MRIKVLLGNSLDGAVWSRSAAELGKLVLGTRGFLAFLEGRLGLAGAGVSNQKRIGLYRQKYQDWLNTQLSAGQEPNDLFAAVSFQTDSWSTAKALLSFRDELIEGGWKPQTGGGKRISLLTELELADPALPPGESDRLCAVLEALQTNSFSCKLPFDVQLNEPSNLFKPIWRRIFSALKERSVPVQEPEPIEENLNRLEVTAVTAGTELELAADAARYLAAGTEEANTGVTLLCQGDSGLLDGILHRYGYGKIGTRSPSANRPSQRLLPLFLETIWKPFRPDLFLDLLFHPYKPIPYPVRGPLIDSISQEPGMGEKWQNAWKEGEKPRAEESEEETKKRVENLRKLRKFIESPADPKEGISVKELIDRLNFLHSRLFPKRDEFPGLKQMLSQIAAFKELAELEKSEKLTRVEITRILGIVIGQGTCSDAAEREVTPFRVITDPGELADGTDTLLWFNFIQEKEERGTFWTKAEQEYFARNGVEIDPSLSRKQKDWKWKSCFAGIRNRAILFIPRVYGGEEAFPHPYLNDIAAAKQTESEKIDIEKLMIDTESLISRSSSDDTADWHLADRHLKLNRKEQTAVQTVLPMEEDGTCTLRNPILIAPEYSFSATGTGGFLGCPFKWVVGTYLNIKDNYPPEITSGPPLYGNLTHKIYEQIFSSVSVSDADAVKSAAAEKFEELVPQTAAELDYPENQELRRNIKARVAESAVFLADKFREWNVQKYETEFSSGDTQTGMAGHPVNGRIDLLAADSEGVRHLVDYKWSTNAAYEDQNSSKHLQLAFYAHILSSSMSGVTTGFYLVPSKTWAEGDRESLQQIWEEAEKKVSQYLAELKQGKVRYGTHDKNEKFQAECKYCKLAPVCERGKGQQN